MQRTATILLVLWGVAAAWTASEDRGGEVSGLLITLKSTEAGQRAGAARSLGEIGPAAKDAVPGLIDVLKDPERDVRQCAAKALGEIGTASAPAASALAAVLGDRDWQVRRAAAEALGRIGTREGEAALKAARKDPNESVRKAARASLDRIRKLPRKKG